MAFEESRAERSSVSRCSRETAVGPEHSTLAGLPDVVKRLADDIQWTTDLGNAFLAQQGDVMDAAQRMRKKAQDNGNLKSGNNKG